jgi:hypothetical protein
MRHQPTSRAFGRTALALTLGAAPAFGQTSPADIPGDDLLAPAAAERASIEDSSAARAAFSVQRSVRDMLTAPLVTREGEELWVRTRDSRGRFAAGEFTLFPIFGRAASQEHPIRFTLAGVTRGANDYDTTLVQGAVQVGDRVELQRRDVLESYRLDLDGFEQMFTFDSVPGDGDLVVDLAVVTDLAVELTDGLLRFVHPELGEVQYGAAIAFDANGRRTDVSRHWTGEGIELRVPAEFVASATLPLTIDPVIATFRNDFGVADDGSADIVYLPETHEYMVCWEEFTSAVNGDVYVTKFTSVSLVQSGALAVEMGTANWTDPRIAYTNGHERALVVATVNPNGIGGANGSVAGGLVDPTAFTLDGSTFTISTVGATKSGACVGGNSRVSTFGTHFCVAWAFHVAAGDADLQYRIVDGDGSFVTSIVTIDSSAENDVQPAISASQGNTNLPGDFWTLVWIRDADDNGRGEVWARCIGWDGSTALGAGNFQVNANTQLARPSVTSRFNELLQVGGDRPAIVAYDRSFGSVAHPSGLQRSIYMQVVTDGAAGPIVGLNTTLEDFDAQLDQWGASIVREGKGFFVTYAEESWAAIGFENWDMYAAAGSIVDLGASVKFALSERHLTLASGFAPEYDGRVCSMVDSNAVTTHDNGAVIWTEETATAGFGKLRGALLESITLDVSPDRAVGVQYCHTNPNSVGTYGGRNKSWLWVEGTRSAAQPHVVRAVDLPQNSFGYLLVSATTGDVNLAGGSQGRLCLGGSIGRYVSAIANSGPSGLISTSIDPTALPQPTGSVAALPGQTWNFQLWHRDSVGGFSTSNFTNGCAVTFTP